MQMLLPDGTIVDKQFSGTRFDDFVLGGSGKVIMRYLLDVTPKDRKIFNKYRLYPLFDRETIHEWWKLNKNGWGDIGSEYQNNQEVEATFYDIDEKISAGYLTNILNYGSSISLITGIRVEYENNEYKSKYSPDELFSYPAPHGTINDTTAIHKETIWLPNFHLTIRPTDFMSFRLAAYRALARPDFNQRLEIFIARAGGFLYSANTLTVGNSRLQAAKAWNYEINTSLYESTYGLFSASAFYKDVKDMFHMINGLPFASGYSLDSLGITYNNPFTARGFDLVYPFNSKKPTRVWGFEIEVQTNLRYLPGFLKNFVVNGNFSFVRSETYIPLVYLETYMDTIPGWPWPIEKSRTVLTDKKQKLEGQPEFFGNLALGYDIGGFSARISVFYQGEYNTEFSPDRTEDGIQKAFTRWDLILKQRITKNMEIFMNINNLTNAKEGTATLNRIQGWRFMNQSETYGLTGDLGLRITL
jgi:TonB-dependent receptor